MKRIAILLLFLTFKGMLFGQQTADSCIISTPAKLEKQGCGDQQIHIHFESSCPVQDLEITIHNRWGNVLNVSYQLDYYLPGKIMESGTYFFTIKGVFPDGRKVSQNGFFNLL